MRRSWPAIAVVAAVALAGCGLVRSATSGVQLTVTRAFGAQSLAELPAPKLGGDDSVLALTERNATAQTGAGGAVRSIDGASAGAAARWSLYVNGIATTKTGSALNSGDHVWWDLHEAAAAGEVRAVVGSFPEPFLHGSGGRKLPVVVECSNPTGSACSTVATALSNAGVPVARGGLLLAAGATELRVLVGDWPALLHDRAAAQIGQGPAHSGVFARLSSDGATITVLDKSGNAVRTLGAHSGLIAATRYRFDEPVWVVTGTDAAGIDAAARAFEPGALHDRFALAIAPDDIGIALPQ